MERERYSQLELFTPSQKNLQLEPVRPRRRFFSFSRGYEKFILTAILFIATAVFSFSAGVEKGKASLAARKFPQTQINQRSATEFKPISAPSYQAATQRPAKNQRNDSGAIKKETVEKYTILLATYFSKSNAEREASSLKKKGFTPLVLSSGRYTILCVGSFPDKTKAKALCLRLQNEYQGCKIRRL